VISRAVMRAHQVRSVGPGQRYLMEREWLPDGRVMQRINEGTPEAEREWKQIGRWLDLEKERAALAQQGWEID
jgi:hypothetical protein